MCGTMLHCNSPHYPAHLAREGREGAKTAVNNTASPLRLAGVKYQNYRLLLLHYLVIETGGT